MLQLSPVQISSKGQEMINFLSQLFSSWMQISIFQDEAREYPNELAIQFGWQARIQKINGLNKEGKNEPVISSQLIKLSCRELMILEQKCFWHPLKVKVRPVIL